MLEVRSIDAYYASSQILHGVSLSVRAGERVAVIGRNGAGKSTLLKSIMNAGPRTEGVVAWDGAALADRPPFRRARLGMQFVPEDRRVYGHLTVAENIRMGTHAAPAGRKGLPPEEVIARIPMLGPIARRYGNQISGGQQQMVAIARAVASRPRLMLLDEPTEGLAPAIVERLAEDVRAVSAGDDTALLLCEQNLWFARTTTDRVYVIDAGTIVFDGDWAAFDDRKDIKQRYLAV